MYVCMYALWSDTKHSIFQRIVKTNLMYMHTCQDICDLCVIVPAYSLSEGINTYKRVHIHTHILTRNRSSMRMRGGIVVTSALSRCIHTLMEVYIH